ncbi:class I SAM-dependent methyltransferase [Shimazuella sp. AN120528]|uniref:SAM-dependent methyltransferase n=1 Tax=Shimazuella soli TaxID=1892854 RepID=UPI001F0E1977|nr:class I SAM-dependent methyltransferase [Shimazuella soli]MCH5586116.1 class I SAM-dependent methyltransferase [Shimazuella soli]
MKSEKSSITAVGIALMRAIESSKPENERICFDPFARSFVNNITYLFSKWMISSGLYEKFSHGALAFVTARERYIDDFLKKCLLQDFDQIVILGAGFDTRAYRIDGIEKTQVFEVDHPATQKVKLQKLKNIINPLPKNVMFVSVDFNTQNLRERLLQNGYLENKKTLFIWQGVTVYLNPEGVDSTLSFIADHSSSGSAVIFDYYYRETLQDKDNVHVKSIHRSAKWTGENYIFGIEEGTIDQFLADRGFRDIHNASIDELKRLYFKGVNAKRIMLPGLAIAYAYVK